MVKSEKAPFGEIYRANNNQNGKVYIGQTGVSRWGENEKPMEERWKEEVREAYSKQRRGVDLRYIENAIIKYGEENFDLKKEAIAYSQEELDKKETNYINKYDSMNPAKGYNLKEGGRGGRLSEMAKEKLSKIGKEKWQKDLEYQRKQINERQERAKNSEWLKKMAEVNQKIARNQETLDKMSKVISKKWQDQKYQESVSKGVTGKWQEEKYRERQFKSRVDGKREIPDKRKFLNDIREMQKKDLNKKHDMNGKCINKRIEEMLGHRGVKNFSQAKEYLKEKNLDDVVKEINNKLDNQSQKFEGKKEISNKREFLKDIQNMQKKEIDHKYNMNGSTVNNRIREMLGEHGVKNYTEAKKYLEDKNLDEVVKEINEKEKNQSQKFEGTTTISNKREFLKDIQELQKNEIDMKYRMDAKTVNNKIREMLGEHGVKNYTEAKNYLKNKNIDEVLKDIEVRNAEKQADTQTSESKSEDSEKEGKKEKATEEEKKESSEVTSEKPSEAEKEGKKEESTEEEKKEPSEVTSEKPSEWEKEGKKEELSEEQIEEPQDTNVEKTSEKPEENFNKSLKNLSEIQSDVSSEKYSHPLPQHGGRVLLGSQGDNVKAVIKKHCETINKSLTDTDSHKNLDYKGIDEISDDRNDDLNEFTENSHETGNDFDGIDEDSSENNNDYDNIDEDYHNGGAEGGGEGGGEA